MSSELTRIELIQFAARLAEREHSELRLSWQNLDAKAQATAAIAGGTLAILFAFVRDATAHKLAGLDFVLLIATLLALVIATGLALWCMRIRDLAVPPDSSLKISEVEAVLRCPEVEFTGRALAALRSSLAPWHEVNEKAHTQLEVKGKWLYGAQIALMFSMLFTAGLVAKLAL
jgi:hypothetical protein